MIDQGRVRHLFARRVSRFDVLDDGFGHFLEIIDVPAGLDLENDRKTRLVREQVPDPDFLPVVTFEFRDQFADRRSQHEPALLDSLHHQYIGERFGHRENVENRITGQWLPAAAQGTALHGVEYDLPRPAPLSRPHRGTGRNRFLCG